MVDCRHSQQEPRCCRPTMRPVSGYAEGSTRGCCPGYSCCSSPLVNSLKVLKSPAVMAREASLQTLQGDAVNQRRSAMTHYFRPKGWCNGSGESPARPAVRGREALYSGTFRLIARCLQKTPCYTESDGRRSLLSE